MMTRHFDVIVIGGGLVGAAIAFGLRDLGSKLAVCDEGDVAYRAARGNFGLIWVQGKGLGLPPYGAWTQRSAREWPRFAALLRDETGIDVALRQQGGAHVCLSQRELDLRSERFAQLFAQPGFERYDVEILDRAEMTRRLPGMGPDVVGGTWSALDGDCNPLRLLRALDAGLERAGVVRLGRDGVVAIEPHADRFGVRTASAAFTCARVVLAAGLGNARLAPMVGMKRPSFPTRARSLRWNACRRFCRCRSRPFAKPMKGPCCWAIRSRSAVSTNRSTRPSSRRSRRGPCACFRSCATCASFARGRRCA